MATTATTTEKIMKGWNNVKAPASLTVKVGEWMQENGFDADDVALVGNLTLQDYAACFDGNICDTERMDAMSQGHLDTYLRDAIFDAIQAVPFFVAGGEYRCKKGVRGSFRKGRTYIPRRVNDYFAWFQNDKGEPHTWPQPENIGFECKAHDMKWKDIDPRFYFERVD